MPTRKRRPLTLRLDFDTGLPAYLQIYRQIQRQVDGGSLAAGYQLPTVRELAVQLGVNFNTVARAYRLLDRSALVSAQQGRGTFIVERTTSARSNSVTLQTLAAQYIAAARQRGFSRTQIAAAVAQRLKSAVAHSPSGDSHG
jgi:GntR family transcriptional regulator